jgi:hypothetical protein
LSQTISAEKILKITMSGGGLAPSLSDVLDGKADAVLSHDPAANKVTKASLADPDPGSGAFIDPWIRDG